jgi:RNA recognition motif-containing protein
VANLPFATTDEELKTLFNAHAPVVSAHVVTRKNGRSKGFGFVEFGGKDDQAKALKAVDGTEYNSRTLNVNVALKVSPTDAASSSEAPTSAGVAPVANGEAKAPAAEESKGKEVDTATA